MHQSRVLIVDDEKSNIAILANALDDQYLISTATSGEEALRIVYSDLSPDLILLDVLMPGMNGFDVCKELKRDIRSVGIPIIFVTAMDDSINEEHGLAVGAVDYISKPISPPVVLRRIELHLELKRYQDFLEDLLDARTEELSSARQLLDGSRKLFGRKWQAS